MAFENLDISISGEAADAQAALQSVKSSLRQTSRQADRTDRSLEDLGDTTTGLAGRLAGLTASASASTASLLGLSSVAAGSSGSFTALGASIVVVTGALVGLSAVIAPLVAAVGAVAAAATGLATAFGAVVGSGLLAFGEQRAEQNREQLEQVQSRIEELEQLKDTQGSLNEAQAAELEQLEEKASSLEDATSATGALRQVIGDLIKELKPLVVELGEAFVPLIKDALDAIPGLVEDIISALGPLDQFADTLRDFGRAAREAIPAAVGGLIDLARRALPVALDFFRKVRESTDGLIDDLVAVTEAIAEPVLGVAGALGDLLPTLTETGVILINILGPAVEGALGGLNSLLQSFNDFATDDSNQQTFREIAAAVAEVLPSTEEAAEGLGNLISFLTDIVSKEDAAEIFSALQENLETTVPAVIEFGEAIAPILSDLVDELPGIIEAVGTVTTDLVQLATAFTTTVRPAIRAIIGVVGEIVDIFNRLPSGVQKAIVALGAIAVVAPTVIGAIGSLVGALGSVVSVVGTIVAILGGPLTVAIAAAGVALLAYQENWLGFRDKVKAAIEAVVSVLRGLKPVVRQAKNTLIRAAQAAINAFAYLTGMGGGRSLKGDILGALLGIVTFVSNEFTLDALVSTFKSAGNDITDALTGLVPDSLTNALSGLFDAIAAVIQKLNDLDGVSIDIDVPDVEDFLPGGGSGGGGGDDSGDSGGGGGGGGGRSSGGAGTAQPSRVGITAAETGGLISEGGLAMLHEGERVVPSAQVVDRGPAPVEGGGGGASAGDLRAAVADALNGATLSIDGDVASIEDVDRRVEERQRRTARRVDARNFR